MADIDIHAPHRIEASRLADAVASLATGQTLRVEPDGGWSETEMRQHMEAAGLVDIHQFTDFEAARFGLEGTKPEQVDRRKLKIMAVISAPRLCFTTSAFCVMRALVDCGMQIEVESGAFWGQCIERALCRHVESGEYDYILTIDYDSVFTPQHVRKLADLMERTPEAAAIAAWQIKREDEASLFKPIGHDGKAKTAGVVGDYDGALTEVAWAHFGLTMFRPSMLVDLPHPWFHGQPNAEGRWEAGRTDDDIYFWNKLREHGKRAFVANHVAIGHAQLVVTWPDAALRPRHQYLGDWNAHGVPSWARK